MEEFEYCNGDTYEENFNRWYGMNCKERANHNEDIYSKKEGLEVFRKMHRGSLAHTIRINAKGLLEDVLVRE